VHCPNENTFTFTCTLRDRIAKQSHAAASWELPKAAAAALVECSASVPHQSPHTWTSGVSSPVPNTTAFSSCTKVEEAAEGGGVRGEHAIPLTTIGSTAWRQMLLHRDRGLLQSTDSPTPPCPTRSQTWMSEWTLATSRAAIACSRITNWATGDLEARSALAASLAACGSRTASPGTHQSKGERTNAGSPPLPLHTR
jgi:hypothetical protein